MRTEASLIGVPSVVVTIPEIEAGFGCKNRFVVVI